MKRLLRLLGVDSLREEAPHLFDSKLASESVSLCCAEHAEHDARFNEGLWNEPAWLRGGSGWEPTPEHKQPWRQSPWLP